MPRDIDQIMSLLRREMPGIQITQLQVTQPGADDDGMWFMSLPGRRGEVQIESSTGERPFLIACNLNNESQFGRSVYEVAGTVWKLLVEPGASPNGGPAVRPGSSGTGGGPPSVS